MNAGKEKNFITRLGIAIGGIVNKFYAAGRETIDIIIKTVIPFMAFVSMILGIISASGLGNVIANILSPIASTLPGMLAISFICALLGAQIGMGNRIPTRRNTHCLHCKRLSWACPPCCIQELSRDRLPLPSLTSLASGLIKVPFGEFFCVKTN